MYDLARKARNLNAVPLAVIHALWASILLAYSESDAEDTIFGSIAGGCASESLEHTVGPTFTVVHKQRALPVLVSLLSSWSNTEVKHRLLADAGLAPKLLYHGPLGSSTDVPSYGSLRMVVMEEAEGTNAFVLYQDREVLDLFLASVREAVRELHAYGFVFGDLRRQNIMVSPGGKVKLIDFDWAGKDGEAMYPIRMSNKIRWAPGVGAMEKMYKAHDNFMIDRL
ncbi:uncharacterized protein ARMOST_16444 [Armillaria ostoyae]|uniref:Protein kinase domain-containing protein n=1 Tax=Armillaria ostoyae TaxID=47428 RepID=A0A284RW74_ARMOS|nr:uncharacterized protein ARMOST_16444 [Armillaria ostoyae]